MHSSNYLFNLERCSRLLLRHKHVPTSLLIVNISKYAYRVWELPAEVVDVATTDPGDGFVALGDPNPGACSAEGKF